MTPRTMGAAALAKRPLVGYPRPVTGELKLVGYWIESIWDSYPPPQELTGGLPEDARRRLADYLDAGAELTAFLGMSWCRFGCRPAAEELGAKELHDGEWAWPEGLGHYVREHGVSLPEELVRKALSGTADGIPALPPDQPRSLDFWLSWSAARRSGALQPALERARAEAWRLGEEAEERRVRTAAVKTARIGESDAECVGKGCARKALKGLAYCALCRGGPRRGPEPSRAFDSPEALVRVLNQA